MTVTTNSSLITAIESMQIYFKFHHLPARLQAVSRPFAELASTIVGSSQDTSTSNNQKLIALQKLLEAKDAAVRGSLG